MALETNELYNEQTRDDQKRLFPDANVGVRPRMLVAVSGGASLLQGTPLAVHTTTGLWHVYTQGGANGLGTISGILMEDITINDSGSNNTETLAQVMLGGRLHRDDVNTAEIRALLNGSPSEANLDAALRAPTMREKGLHVEGLDLVQ